MKRVSKKLLVVATGIGLIVGNFSAIQSSAATVPNQIAKSSIEIQTNLKQQDVKYISDQTLLIKYSKPLKASEHQKAGGTVIKQVPHLSYSIVSVKNKKNFQKVMAAYQKLGTVVSVTPSIQYKTFNTQDPKSNQQYYIKQLNLEKSQSLAGNTPVTVAVIDQGVDTKHPDLKDRLLPSYNAVNPMNQGSPDFHGTHVTGIIAANKNNSIGGYGVNPNAKILPIDVFDRQFFATDYTIAQGILYAVEKGAKVINMSLGGPIKSPIIEEAVNKALEKNIVIVAAAGNTGDATPSYPAAYEGVISVGSTNEEKKLSSFSSFGPSIDVVAPGEDIYSTIYDYEKKSTFMSLDGTSMASPVVAGIASLLFSKYPQLTPTQVEYILEHSAQDLGAEGYDTKYGNGLVDPVKALQYNIKSLPSLTKTTWNEKEIKAYAKKVTLKGKETLLKDTIVKPFDEKWYKTDVKKGDPIQFRLEGASQFDYKLMLYLESPDRKERVDINKVLEGKKEGKLYEVPFTGTLYFGVKDVNGSYDDSNKKRSYYSLSVQSLPELPEDESSIEKPIDIQLPYTSKSENYTLLGSKGDDDYFSFSVTEEQVVRVDLSAIPGTDTSIGVYDMKQFIPDEGTGKGMSEEEKKMMIEQLFSGKEPVKPTYFANKGSASEEESLTFTAQPKGKFLIKITNKPSTFYFDPFDYLFNNSLLDKTPPEPENSAIPYTLDVKGKVLPRDEDEISFMFFNEEKPDEKVNVVGAKEEEFNYTQMVQDGARPYRIGDQGEGYLQSPEDEDWYSVTPEKTGIYEFKFPKMKQNELPMIEVYQLVEEPNMNNMFGAFAEGEKEEEPVDTKAPSKDEVNDPYLNMIGSNFDYMGMVKENMYTGLKEGETYYIKVAPNYNGGTISFDPYRFDSKLILADPQDSYEDNDALEDIKDFPETSVQGNFAMPNDVDAFYYESKTKQINGVSLQTQTVDPKEKSKYPAELYGNYYGFITILEDQNKNRKVDKEEYDSARYIMNIQVSGITTGSFQTEKGKNYIILSSAFFEGPLPLSLTPYELKMEKVNDQDEDKGSIVKNNVPTKPIKLNQKSNSLFEAKGYLNAGVPYGDQDWYELKLTKDTKGQISLSAGAEIDGVISIYQNGKLVTTSDLYAIGDQEVLAINLKKGTYHLKIEDTFNNASLTPYTLKVSSSK